MLLLQIIKTSLHHCLTQKVCFVHLLPATYEKLLSGPCPLPQHVVDHFNIYLLIFFKKNKKFIFHFITLAIRGENCLVRFLTKLYLYLYFLEMRTQIRYIKDAQFCVIFAKECLNSNISLIIVCNNNTYTYININ